jgi:hypothetical protein
LLVAINLNIKRERTQRREKKGKKETEGARIELKIKSK